MFLMHRKKFVALFVGQVIKIIGKYGFWQKYVPGYFSVFSENISASFFQWSSHGYGLQKIFHKIWYDCSLWGCSLNISRKYGACHNFIQYSLEKNHFFSQNLSKFTKTSIAISYLCLNCIKKLYFQHFEAKM